VLIDLHARPQGYSERTGQVWAPFVSTSVRFGHMVGQSDLSYNHIINSMQGVLN